MKHLIVTADDFGVFPAINEGVIEAVKENKVNSVAAFANYKGEVLPGAPAGTRFEDALTNLRWLINETEEQNPDIGCHLTVTSGKPLTGNKMDFACDRNGNFYSFGNFKNFKEKSQLKNLYDELCAQIEELKSVPGCKVKHLTNHHNSLTLFPHHFEVYVNVAAKFKLPMRSADVRPKGKQSLYVYILDRLLTGDIPKSEREEMNAFQTKIAEEFRKNHFGVKAPDYLESSHYGPPGVVPAARLLSHPLVHKKHKQLDSFFNDFRKSGEKSVELLLHIAKPSGITVERSRHLDYSGVDRSYFDGRAIELKSILNYPVDHLAGIERRGWEL